MQIARDLHPSFGSPAKAPAELVEIVQQLMGDGPALPTTATIGGAR